MAVVVYRLTRQGGMALKFEGKDGTSYMDPGGMRNPQLAKILGDKLMGYVRCEVGNGVAEVLGEATAEEVGALGGRGPYWRCPPVAVPRRPGSWVEWVASMRTGIPCAARDCIWGMEVMSLTRRL